MVDWCSHLAVLVGIELNEIAVTSYITELSKFTLKVFDV